LGQEAYELYVQQQCCGGLNFGYFYGNSPIIAYDGASHPVYSMGRFESSSVPGCRAPHLWLNGRYSLYDACGAGFALLRLDPRVRVSGLIHAAAQQGVPLKIVEVDQRDAQSLYANKLVLLRPDRHVAWRGDEEPADPVALIDLLRGARNATAWEGPAGGGDGSTILSGLNEITRRTRDNPEVMRNGSLSTC
jgi:hypothetical protein